MYWEWKTGCWVQSGCKGIGCLPSWWWGWLRAAAVQHHHKSIVSHIISPGKNQHSKYDFYLNAHCFLIISKSKSRNSVYRVSVYISIVPNRLSLINWIGCYWFWIIIEKLQSIQSIIFRLVGKFFKNILYKTVILFLIFIYWLCQEACGILVPQLGTEPIPPAVDMQNLNHWTTREVLGNE